MVKSGEVPRYKPKTVHQVSWVGMVRKVSDRARAVMNIDLRIDDATKTWWATMDLATIRMAHYMQQRLARKQTFSLVRGMRVRCLPSARSKLLTIRVWQ